MKSITQRNPTVNPMYAKFSDTWKKMRDSIEGEVHMKERTLKQNTVILNKTETKALEPVTSFNQYIRPTDSMRKLGKLGTQRFCDYVYRAKYYPFPLDVREQSLGLIENEPAVMELPTQLESMLENATSNKESLDKVLSQIYTEQLEVSRVGILLNPSADITKAFNIGIYKTEALIDWHVTVKDNSEAAFDWVKLRTDELSEDNKPIYLILTLEDGVYVQYKTTNAYESYGSTIAEVLITDGYISESFIVPMEAEKPAEEIPFVVINLTKLGAEIERPFLESVTDAAISLFRASAHHEDALYWGGESTMFTKGYGIAKDNDTVYVGNGAINKTSVDYADAKIVTMGTDGIAPRQEREKTLFEFCVMLGVDLLNKGSESGVALNVRSNVKTASLKTLALTGAEGLEVLLRIGARWLGIDDKLVSIIANTTFADIQYTADDFVKFSGMVEVGAMRRLDLYLLQKKHKLTTAETFEDWKDDMEVLEVNVPNANNVNVPNPNEE